jgi:hypothetical protein
MKLNGETIAMGVDEGIDAARIGPQFMKILGRHGLHGTIGGGAKLKGTLLPVVFDEAGAEDLGELAGGVAAEHVHLPETVLRCDEALREEEVVDVACANGGYALRVARDGHGCGEAWDMERAVDLRERCAHGVSQPYACDNKTDRRDDCKDDESEAKSAEDPHEAARGALGCPGSCIGPSVAASEKPGLACQLYALTRRPALAFVF